MEQFLIIVAVIGTLLQGIGVKTGAVQPGWIGLAAFIATFII